MLGAIIGDIVGSRFEFSNHRSKEFDLFADGCFATDDSIMTLAVAKAIMEAFKIKTTNNREYDQDFHNKLSDLTVKYMQEIGRKYPNCGFGGMFYHWVFSDNPAPYNSFGNGAAMRVSPAGFAAANELEAMQLAETVTAVTHDHEEGIKGAEATAVAIFLARKGATKREISERIVRDYYPLGFKIDDIRATYHFNETCQETVPQAIECFLESTSFEDAIRTAVSLGGDSDTIGAITGAIAEAYYGVPEEIKEKALTYLDDELVEIYSDWDTFMPPYDEQFRVLTKYIGKLSPKLSIVSDYIHEPSYETLFNEFYDEFMHFIKISYPQHCDEGVFYTSILRDKDFSEAEVAKGNVDDIDAPTLLAIIHRELISGSHWNYNEIASFKESKFVKWLKRLKDIDWQKNPRCITAIKLELGWMGGYSTHCVTITNTTASFTLCVPNYGDIGVSIDERKKVSDIRKVLEIMHFQYWLSSYPQEGEMLVCDGEQWSLIVKYDDGTILDINGDNTYPENWNALLEFFGVDCDDHEDNPKRQPGEVIYCSVSFDNSKTYYYTTEDESIEIGDEVIVPVGADGNELTGVVEDIEYFLPEDVPFPLDRTKTIIRKAYEFEDDEEINEDGPTESSNEPIGDVLDLSADDTEVHFSINGFGNGLDGDYIRGCSCLVSIRVKNSFFDYDEQDVEMFDFGELLTLHRSFSKAAKGRIGQAAWVDFMEPDINFFVDNDHGELRLNLSGCNTQFYSIPLYKEDVKRLSRYLDSRIVLLRKQWRGNHEE